MNRLKLVILIQWIIIVILVLGIFYVSLNGLDSPKSYCEKHYYDSQLCLLSPRVYANIIAPKNLLILNFNPLKENIQNYISQNNYNASVYIENLRDGASFGINSSISYPAASLNKIPIAIITLRKVEAGNLSLDSVLPITDDERDSSSGSLYSNPVKELSVRQLLHYMLSESDNTAAWVLQKDMTQNDLSHLTDYLGYYTNDIESEKTPLNVTDITAKSVSSAFTSLYLSTALTPEDSEFILSELKNTSFDIKKYADLPDNVTVAQKFGFHYLDDGSYFHSCGILYVEDSRFFYCVMTKDLSREKAPEVIGTIVNKLYNFIVEQKKIKDIDV